jgi:hypothetical protein
MSDLCKRQLPNLTMGLVAVDHFTNQASLSTSHQQRQQTRREQLEPHPRLSFPLQSPRPLSLTAPPHASFACR